jgi:iron complex outermembrane receptor protein
LRKDTLYHEVARHWIQGWQQVVELRVTGRSNRFCALAILLVLIGVGRVYASEPVYELVIPATKAAEALDRVAKISGHSLFYPTDDRLGAKVNALNGSYTLPEALDALLKDTSLNAVVTAKGVIVVSMQPETQQYGKGKGKMEKTNKGLMAALIGMFSAAEPAGVIAQEQPKDVAPKMEEIIVTAEKREASLQETPVAISAFPAEMIDKLAIEDIRSLQFSVPGLTVAASRQLQVFTIRGVGQDNTLSGAESGVVTNLDGVYQARSYAAGMSLFDLERVEVLRGPQGTLYGKNATGGVINYITNKPTDEFEFNADLTLGNYDRIMTRGAVNLPLKEGKAAFRLSWLTEDRDGYYDNTWKNITAQDIDTKSFRAHLLLTPTPDVEILLSAFQEHVGGNDVTSLELGQNAFALPRDPDVFKIREDADTFEDNQISVYSAKLTWNLGNVVFSSLTANSETKRESVTDWDQTELPLWHFDLEFDADQFTQEFQLRSNGKGSLDWQLGLFYFSEEIYDWYKFPGTFLQDFSYNLDFKNTSKAAYAQGTYAINDKLSLTAGLRYTEDEKKGFEQQLVPPAFGGPLSVTFPFDDGWEEVTWKAGIEYAASRDMFLYGSVSRGYRGGGKWIGQAELYDPEYVTAYEAGLKSQFFDNRAQVNVAVYNYDYKDKQVRRTAYVEGNPAGVTDNASKASVKGVEVDFQFLPTSSLRINGTVAYTNGQFDEYFSIDESTPEFAALGLQDLSGNQLPRTPEWAFTLGAEYAIELGEAGTLTPRIDYVWKDESYMSGFNREAYVIPSYDRTNLRLRYDSPNGRWYTDAFVLNLDDDADIMFRLPKAFGPESVEGGVAPPRTFGLRIGYRH